MAINNVKTARDARLVGTELVMAAQELYLGLLMTGDPDPVRVIQAIHAVGEDYIKWAESKADDEEVFLPADVLASLDQTQAEVDEFLNNN
jgi:hypothetical protein